MPNIFRYRSHTITTGAALGFALYAGMATAHPGHAHDATPSMLAAGLLHPLTGPDHLLAMLAVGLWAAMSCDRLSTALWTPMGFAGLLFAGAVAGIAGMAVPAVEPLIMASLLVLGLLLAWRVSLSRTASVALVSFFALFHGLAHGAELPPEDGAALFIAGFMLSTLALHAIGLASGFALKRHAAWLSRLAGAGVALYGAALLAMAA